MFLNISQTLAITLSQYVTLVGRQPRKPISREAVKVSSQEGPSTKKGFPESQGRNRVKGTRLSQKTHSIKNITLIHEIFLYTPKI